ncbi:MAG: hypothetical protein ACRD3W_25020 [Terriglobales bacterium]
MIKESRCISNPSIEGLITAACVMVGLGFWLWLRSTGKLSFARNRDADYSLEYDVFMSLCFLCSIGLIFDSWLPEVVRQVVKFSWWYVLFPAVGVFLCGIVVEGRSDDSAPAGSSNQRTKTLTAKEKTALFLLMPLIVAGIVIAALLVFAQIFTLGASFGLLFALCSFYWAYEKLILLWNALRKRLM